MKQLLVALCLALATSVAFAKEEKAATPQQSKMAGCNKEAKEKDMKGADRKAFMKSCLSNKPAAAAAAATTATAATTAEPKKELSPQQQKMKNCNKEAKEKALKGAERKSFMSGCLKGDAKPAEKK